MRTYHEERRHLRAEADFKRARLEQRMGELSREIDRLVDAIAKGLGDPAILGPRSTALNEERKQTASELQADPGPPEAVSLHPAVLARYEQQLGQLQQALARGTRGGDSEAAEAMRELVETVTVFRDPSRVGGVMAEITVRLNALLGEKAYANGVRGVWGKMVAEDGSRFSRPRLRVRKLTAGKSHCRKRRRAPRRGPVAGGGHCPPPLSDLSR